MLRKLSLTFLLTSVLIFSQNQVYPDTLIFKKGVSIPCIITEQADTYFTITYETDKTGKGYFVAISKIFLDTLGYISIEEVKINKDIRSYLAKRKIRDKIPPIHGTFITGDDWQSLLLSRPVFIFYASIDMGGRHKASYEYERLNHNVDLATTLGLEFGYK
jgi:hypothetical protein